MTRKPQKKASRAWIALVILFVLASVIGQTAFFLVFGVVACIVILSLIHKSGRQADTSSDHMKAVQDGNPLLARAKTVREKAAVLSKDEMSDAARKMIQKMTQDDDSSNDVTYQASDYESVSESLADMDPDQFLLNGRVTRLKNKQNPFEL